jgi:hypothetical protein
LFQLIIDATPGLRLPWPIVPVNNLRDYPFKAGSA